jgi:hypothetical protein
MASYLHRYVADLISSRGGSANLRLKYEVVAMCTESMPKNRESMAFRGTMGDPYGAP